MSRTAAPYVEMRSGARMAEGFRLPLLPIPYPYFLLAEMLGPIFLRELLTVPRRGSHYATRAAYLGSLWGVPVTPWLAVLGWVRPATLGENARFGPALFWLLTNIQLALFLFFSALSCASAVAKEKDRRTFVLLLMTDLRNHEIVL